MTNEAIITDFMRKHYTDERLAQLLAHAEDGKLSHMSCCCFAGVPTANHALKGENLDVAAADEKRHWLTSYPDGGGKASYAFNLLAETDFARRAKIIPLIRAEIQRRERERSESSSESLPAETVLSV